MMHLYRFAFSSNGEDADLLTLGLVSATGDEHAFDLGCRTFARNVSAPTLARRCGVDREEAREAFFTVERLDLTSGDTSELCDLLDETDGEEATAVRAAAFQRRGA